MARAVVCPKCGSSEYERIRFAWWSGMLGPRLFRYVRCKSCGRRFSARFGKRLFWFALLYNVLVFALGACMLAGVLWLVLRSLAA